MIPRKAIRSSGWKTDMMIGFPDGLLLLLFTTQILYTKALTVQAFYSIHLLLLGISTLLMMIAVFRANRGEDDDEGVMTPEERQKLQRLDLSQDTIAHIADEMQSDQKQWEQTLQQEQVQLRGYSWLPAVRSMLATGLFFLLGGLVVFVPFLMQEDFNAAAKVSLALSVSCLLIFAFLKSRITGQRAVRTTLRYLVLGSLVLLASYLITSAI